MRLVGFIIRIHHHSHTPPQRGTNSKFKFTNYTAIEIDSRCCLVSYFVRFNLL